MMSTNKQPQGKSDDEWAWSNDDDELLWLSHRQKHTRTIISRAVVTYFVLFFGAGLIMSVFGVNPLAKQGLMPKALLLFVGMSLLIALANMVIEDWAEHRQSWFGFFWRNRRSKLRN